MELGTLDDDLLLGDAAEAVVPPSLVASAPVMDIGFHPQLPILAAGLVTGEVEIYEYHGNEIVKKPIVNDFSSWVFGRNKQYSDSEVVLNYHHNNMRMHPTGGVSSMEFTDDGNFLVTTSSDRTMSVMDCVSSRLVIHITAAENEAIREKKKKLNKMNSKAHAFPVVGKASAAAAGAAAAKLKKRKRVEVNPNPHKYGISALNVCDENLVATGDDDGLICIWDMRTRKPAHTYHEHGDYVSQLVFFTDVQELVSSSGDTCLGVYDVRGGRVRDFSAKRKDELSCFAFINSTGVNSATFIPTIMCGTPSGSLPLWKYGSWARPYDLLDRHPRECESIVSFHGEESPFNHNIVLTGACDGLVRVIQMYPLRRNLCQLSARDYTYSHANALGAGGSAHHYHNSNYIVKNKRGQEGISRMRVSCDGNMLAVCGSDDIVDFVDIRFLNCEKELDKLRNKSEQRHMETLRRLEVEREEEAERERRRLERGGDADEDDEEEAHDVEEDGVAGKAGIDGRSDSDWDSSSSGEIIMLHHSDDDGEGEGNHERGEKKKKLTAGKRHREDASSSGSDDSDSSMSDSSDDDDDLLARFERREAAKKAARKQQQGQSAQSAKRDMPAGSKTEVGVDAVEKKLKPKNKKKAVKKAKESVEKSDVAAEYERKAQEAMEEYQLDRAQKRERVAAAKWLKTEKKKKVNFTFEKRRRRVGGFFGDMVNRD